MSFEKRPEANAVFMPSTPLGVASGTVTLDSGQAPYGLADIDVPLLEESVLELLDPYDNQRVNITASATGTDEREFDLVMTARKVSHDGRNVNLKLATDEAILQRFADIIDNLDAFTVASSLRDVIDGVLGTAIPGASLEAGAADADVTPTYDSQNLIRNPRAAGSGGGIAWDWQDSGQANLIRGIYSTGGPSYAPSYWYMGASGGSVSGAYHYYNQNSTSISGGKEYVLSVATRFDSGITVKFHAEMFDGTNNTVAFATPFFITGTSGVWKRSVIRFFAPATAAKIRPLLEVQGTLASGKFIDVTGYRLSERTAYAGGDEVYFDGLQADTTAYSYDFAAEQWVSNSVRSKLTEAPEPDALVWAAGKTAWDFLSPIVTTTGLRLWCDEQRRWWLIDPATYTVPGRVIAEPSNSATGTDDIDSLSDMYATGVVIAYEWPDESGVTRRAVDTAGTGPYVRRFEERSPYPGPGRAAARLLKFQGQGRTQDVTVGADYTVTPGMQLETRLPGTYDQRAQLQSVTWRLQEGLMELGSRGLADILPGSIDALPGSIDALPGTIDSL